MDGVQLPQGYSHSKEAVYFLPLSSQKHTKNQKKNEAILRKLVNNIHNYKYYVCLYKWMDGQTGSNS